MVNEQKDATEKLRNSWANGCSQLAFNNLKFVFTKPPRFKNRAAGFDSYFYNRISKWYGCLIYGIDFDFYNTIVKQLFQYVHSFTFTITLMLAENYNAPEKIRTGGLKILLVPEIKRT